MLGQTERTLMSEFQEEHVDIGINIENTTWLFVNNLLSFLVL